MRYRIDRLGHQGDGISDGPVFASRTLPGEVVKGDLAGDRLSDIRIETPSEHRVKPPCRHYKSCGGCQLMHASDGFVANWKQDVVRQSLQAQGLTAEILGIDVSPTHSRRRATFSARRTKKGALVGFHAAASDVVCEIPDCHLLDPALMGTVDVLRALTMIGGSRKGELSITVTVSDVGPDILVIGGKPLDERLRLTLASEVERLGIARLTWDGEPIAMRAPPVQQFQSVPVVPPPGAFLQATLQGEAALQAEVSRIVRGAGQIADLFAGCGTFTLPLARDAEVHAVESEASMLRALHDGWRNATGVKHVSTESRDLYRDPLQPAELARFDAVVIDPPRSGARAQVDELVKARCPVLAYVSCNPVSFASDSRALTDGGYELGPIQVVDQFRWSTHIELCASFRLS